MSHFNTLYEHVMQRYNFGGITIHDYVKIIGDWKKEIGGNPDYLKMIQKFVDSDLNIRVLDIVSTTARDGRNRPEMFSAVVGLETASGIFVDRVTIPTKFLEVIGYNVPPSIPKSWKHENKSDRKGEPEPVKTIKDTKAVSKQSKTTKQMEQLS